MIHAKPSVTVVVPVYNSEQSLQELCSRLGQVLPQIAEIYEIILVDDGSHDTSWRVIQSIAESCPWVHGLSLMRNYGQHNAVLCGVRAARYDVVVTVDDDLQHPPEEIPALLHRLADGYDVVYGTPRALPHSLWRNVMSRVTKGLMSYAMGARSVRDISAFRVFRTVLRDAFADYRSPDLLFDVLLSWGTTRFDAVSVNHEPRRHGRSNYGFVRLFNQALLILTGFTTGPLRAASIVGFAFTLIGILVLTYVLVVYFTIGTLPGFAFLASVIALFSGAQLFALGIIGEYVARVFSRSMERPTYTIGEATDDAP